MVKQDLSDKIKNLINKTLERPAARNDMTTEELLQVDDWIEMPPFFQKAVGGKGFPCGHISQIVGESDTGKTTMVMEAIKSTQAAGGLVYLIDAEHKFDFSRLRLMGGNPDAITTLSVDSLEEAWNAVSAIIAAVQEVRKTNPTVKILIVWDSVPASVPDSLLAADAAAHHVSVEAKINNKEVRKIRQAVKRSGVAVIFINHTYWDMPKFGIAKEILKGGKEMFYMSTLIVKTKRRAWLDRQVNGLTEKYGAHSLLEVFKGHLGGRKTTTEFYIVDKGVLDSKADLEAYKQSMAE